MQLHMRAVRRCPVHAKPRDGDIKSMLRETLANQKPGGNQKRSNKHWKSIKHKETPSDASDAMYIYLDTCKNSC